MKQTLAKRQADLKAIMRNDRLRRLYLKHDLYMFGLYYFSHYFFTQSAPFHHEMAKDAMFEDCKILYWIMFGGSAKTTWAKIKTVHALCYGEKQNIGWIGCDLSKSQKNVMSIASELKGNKKIIRDFGSLFWETPDAMQFKSKPKRLGEFATANGGYIRAIGTLGSTRGDTQDQFRPDFYVVDDIENSMTARSIAKTESTIEFMKEVLRGRAVDCEMLVLSNRISSSGAVAWLEKHLDDNPQALIHEVKIYDKKGNITWPDAFVETIKDAENVNAKRPNKKSHVKSLEQIKFDLGSDRFKAEMMNEPVDSGRKPVRKEWIRREPKPDQAMLDMGIAIDPAISEKSTADYFAMAAGGRHKDSGKIYITDSYKTRCNITEQVYLCGTWHKKYPKAFFRVETVAYQKALAQLLSNQKRNKIYIPVTEFKPNTDKLMRLYAIVPFIERGDIVFCEGREIDELLASLFAFPYAEHDDDVDALISLIEGFIERRKVPGLAVA